MRKNKSTLSKRMVSFVAALVITAGCAPSFGGGYFAEEIGSDAAEETVAYLVNEDGSETVISNEELEELREGSFDEMPDEFDVILDDSDQDSDQDSDPNSEWTDDTDLIIVDDGVEFPENEDVFEEAPEAVTEAEEEPVSEESVVEVSADEEELIFDEEALADSEAATEADGENAENAENPEDTEPGGPVSNGGNAEHIVIPELINKDITLLSDPEVDATGNGWISFEGERNLAGSASSLGGSVGSGYFNVDITQNGSTVIVSGSIQSPYQFYGLFVDLTLVAPVVGSSVNQQINMNAFSTGYHTVSLGIIRQNTTTIIDLIGRKYMESNTITATPSYNGVFEVYSNYFNYYPYNMALQNQAGDLFMEYSSNGGKTWTRSGYMRANMIQLYISQGYAISGLKAKTKYKTRIRYGSFVTYSTQYAGDGQSYFFGGPVLNTTTIKTGASKKPKIKSVTAKAVNVKYHQIRHYGRYTGVYLYTERFYTCKIKVTVNLKKKPGTKGIFINGKWVKGNKKTYTKTFSPYPNYYAKRPRGHYKYTVTVRSGQNKNWGGYSPAWSKNKRLS